MLLHHLPPESATAHAVDPKGADDASWTRTDHLLAAVFDRLGVLIWQNENQGRKSPTKRPQPMPRPGVTDEGTRYGRPMSLSDVKKILALSRPGAGQEGNGDGN